MFLQLRRRLVVQTRVVSQPRSPHQGRRNLVWRSHPGHSLGLLPTSTHNRSRLGSALRDCRCIRTQWSLWARKGPSGLEGPFQPSLFVHGRRQASDLGPELESPPCRPLARGREPVPPLQAELTVLNVEAMKAGQADLKERPVLSRSLRQRGLSEGCPGVVFSGKRDLALRGIMLFPKM